MSTNACRRFCQYFFCTLVQPYDHPCLRSKLELIYGFVSQILQPKPYGVISAANTTFPCLLQGVTYVALFSFTYFQRLLRRRVLSAAGHPVLTAEGNRLRTRDLSQRRLKTAKMLFAAYAWYSVCYMAAPIATNVTGAMVTSTPLLQHFLRALFVCGHSTSSVRCHRM